MPALFLALALAGSAAAECPDEAIWGLFPVSADLGGVIPDAGTIRDRNPVGDEWVYTMTWPAGEGRQGISITLRLCPDAADAQAKVREYLDTMADMQPAALGDLAGISRRPGRTGLIACRRSVIVAISVRAVSGAGESDPVAVVRVMLERLDRLPCLGGQAPPAPKASTPRSAPASTPRPAPVPVPPPAIPGPIPVKPPPADAPPGTGEAVREGLVLDLAPDPSGRPALVDQGPHGIGCELRGSPAWVEAPGGGGLRLDGRGDWLLLDAVPQLDLRGDLTLEVLAQVPEEAVTGGGYHMLVWRGDEQGGRDPYGLSITGGQLIFRRDLPKTFQVAWPVRELDYGRFHVFAAVHRSYEQILELWVDGRRVAMARLSGDFKYRTEAMRTQVGAMDNGRSQFLPGVVARVRIFRRPLNPPELAAEADALLAGQ